MAPRPAWVSMAARRRTRCSKAASIVSRRAVGELGRPADLELRRRIPGRQRFAQAARHAVQAIQQLRSKARRKLAPRQGLQLFDPPNAQAMQQRHDRLGQAEGFEQKGAGSREREEERGKGEKLPSSFMPCLACLPSSPCSSIPRQRPRRAGRAGHGGAKLPAVGMQLAEDPLDQRRFAAEQMDDIRNIQQHALGKNVRIDSHQGRELLASRRHGLERCL